jgi:hypothetical protein
VRHYRSEALVGCAIAVLHYTALAFAGTITNAVIGILDGDTIEVLHNIRAERIHLPQSQRHPKERRDPLIRKNGEAHILACYFASYGNHKIRAAIPTKMATKILGIIATSMTTSWVDGGFDYGFH